MKSVIRTTAPSRADRWLAAVTAGGTLLFLLWMFAARQGSVGGEVNGRLYSQITLVVVYAAVVRLMWRAANRIKRTDPAAARSWYLLAIGQVLAACVSLDWIFLLTIKKSMFGFMGGQAAAIIYYLFTFSGLVAYPTRSRAPAQRQSIILDAITVAIAGAVLAWHLLFRPLLASYDAALGTVTYVLLYPTGDAVLFFATTALLLRRPRTGSTMAVRLLALAFAINVLSQVVYMWDFVPKASGGTEWYDAGYITVALLFLGAAWLQLNEPERQTTDVSEEQKHYYDPSLVPYLVVALVSVVALVQAWHVESGMHAALSSVTRAAGSLITDWTLTILTMGSALVTAIVVLRQITVQRMNVRLVAERSMRDARYRALVQYGSDVTLVLDNNGLIQYASESVVRVLNLRPDELIGRQIADLAADSSSAVIRTDLAEVISAGNANMSTAPASCEWVMNDGSGQPRCMEVILSNMSDMPEVSGLVVNARDVTERKALEEALSHRAQHDCLTGLANRAFFRETLSNLVDQACSQLHDREGRNTLAVLYVDLDRFKPVNDGYGHATGDAVLLVVSDRLRSATRGSDMVARLGGDEFAIALAPMRDMAEVELVANRIISSISRPISISDGLEVRVGASAGVSCLNLAHADSALNPRELMDFMLRDADAAMYEAKANGRGHWVMHQNTETFTCELPQSVEMEQLPYVSQH